MMNKSCKVCGQAATVYIIDLVGGVPLERYLCDACATDMNISPQHFQIANIFKELINSLQPLQQKPVQDVKCENCGMTYSLFKKILRFGCERDYELFNAASVLEQLYGTSQHVGKSPQHKSDDLEEAVFEVPTEPEKDYRALRVELQAQLDAAVKAEDYEAAAKLRDEIKTLPESD
jgi:protein arginine kinase activator